MNAAGKDFRLWPSSPLVGAGKPLPADIAQAVGVKPGQKLNIGAL